MISDPPAVVEHTRPPAKTNTLSLEVVTSQRPRHLSRSAGGFCHPSPTQVGRLEMIVQRSLLHKKLKLRRHTLGCRGLSKPTSPSYKREDIGLLISAPESCFLYKDGCLVNQKRCLNHACLQSFPKRKSLNDKFLKLQKCQKNITLSIIHGEETIFRCVEKAVFSTRMTFF